MFTLPPLPHDPVGSSNRPHVGGIEFHRGGLLNEVDGHDDPRAAPFADEKPAESREGTSNDLDLHSFFQVWMGIKWQGARHQLADRLDFILWDGGRVSIDTQDLDDTDGREDGGAILRSKPGETITWKQRKAHHLPPILPAPASLYGRQKCFDIAAG